MAAPVRRAGRQVREVFTRVAAAVSADPVPLAPAGPAVADAVVAVAAAAAAIAGRWPQLPAVSPWEIASAVTGGTLLALCVPRTSSTSCDQVIFVDQATDASLPSDAVLPKIDGFG